MLNRFLFVWLFFLSCTYQRYKGPIEKFLANKNYKYSDKKEDIPNVVLLLMEKSDSTLKITDSKSYDSLCLSDDCNEGLIYNAKLNFVLYSDSEYIISYTKGGVGVHGVIEYYKMGKKTISLTRNVIPPIEDTVNLLSQFTSSSHRKDK